jgi:hypothetical protein
VVRKARPGGTRAACRASYLAARRLCRLKPPKLVTVPSLPVLGMRGSRGPGRLASHNPFRWRNPFPADEEQCFRGGVLTLASDALSP